MEQAAVAQESARLAEDRGRRWRRWLLAAAVALALLQAFRAFHGAETRFITNDGDWYYAYLASLYFDRDLDLSNQMATWRHQVGEPPLALPSGRPTRTAFTIGPALLWLPAFALADAGVGGARALGRPVSRDGYGLAYQLAVALATLAYGMAGVWLALSAAARWLGRDQTRWPAAPAAATAAAAVASPALYYLVFEPTMPHALSVFSASLLIFLWLGMEEAAGPARWLAAGLAGGLCALVRPQDGLLLLLPLSAAACGRRLPWGGLGLLVLGAGAAFLPQMLVWQASFGRPLAVPQGPEFMQWTRPALWQVWFSHHHGLFTWTPAWLLGILGLISTPGSHRQRLLPLLLVFLLESYVNAAARDWWGGDAFGARRFLGLFPLLALGLAGLAARLRGRFLAIAAAAAAANLAMMAAYVAGRIPHG